MRLEEFIKNKLTLLLIGCGIVTTLSYLVLLAVGGGEEWAADATWLPYCASLVIPVLVLLYVVRFYGFSSFEGKVWMFITAGMALWMIAELITAVDILLQVLDAGSLPAILTDNADYPFLAGYVVMALGFLYKARHTPAKFTPEKAFMIYTIVGTFAIISTFLVLLPLMETTMYTQSEKFFMVAYIVLDIILLGLGLAIAMYWGTAVSKGWIILSAALFSMMIADVGYTALDLQGIYFDGSLIELAWVAAYLLIGLAANYQKKLHESFM